MSKIEQLTSEQEAKMIEVRNFWLDFIFSCKNTLNKEQAKEGINFIYKLTNLSSPEIIYVDSPLGCIFMQYILRNLDNVGDNVRDNVWANVGNNVGNNVWINVGGNVGGNDEDNYKFSSYGNISDYGWIAFYDFFTQIGVINNDNFNKFKKLLLSGVYDMIQLENICIVCGLPDRINRDVNGRLHSESNSAIHFLDGYEQYYWHGISVPSEWIRNKLSITKDTIINEKNAEKRRCLQEILGNEFIKLLDIEIIDKDTEGNLPIELYRTVNSDNLTNEYIYYLKVICPSTLREYFLCVPECKNVWEAKAWTFANEKIEIRHGDIGLLNLEKEFSYPIFQS